ncbi:uncharacterized protein LOC117302869 [Asterias rubens]|uniref:uncharacterized protein LOC117302869 n=1 Tax=Asterias rubens TaxID=7604 RepID=UPI0014552B68|nr:uncharacterized protein LOC117302869 [Asterias rubens]
MKHLISKIHINSLTYTLEPIKPPSNMFSKKTQLVEPKASLLTEDEKREFRGIDFPFENLALEGGGSKGLSYVGVVRVFEELGLMKNIKRFAGSSAGSIIATFLALGCDSYEIQKLLDPNFSPLIYDGSWGWLGQLVNLVRKLGAHPGNKLKHWIASTVLIKTGNKNYTFRQLYKESGVELCIVGADLNKMDAVYFHVKTTPDMPIYLAARASASIPAVLRPVKFRQSFFVDGGLLCNYPVHAFDGWYLSMDPKDSYFARFGDLTNASKKWDKSERFGELNDKTLGILLFSTSEQDTMKTVLDDRIAKYGGKPVPTPSTKLSRKMAKKNEKVQNSTDDIKEAVSRLMTMLNGADADKSGSISKEEFRTSFQQNRGKLTANDIRLLFECEDNPDAIFDIIDSDGSGESSDFSRTIGINTKYLDAFDWDMERADKNFLIECGKQATLSYLREHMSTSKQPKEREKLITVETRETGIEAIFEKMTK